MLKRRVYLFPSDPTTAPAASRQLEREGWVLLRGVFGPDEVDQLRREIGDIYEAEPPDARQSHQVAALAEQFRYEMFNRLGACQRAMANRAILDVVEPLLGEDCHVIANTAWRNPANVEHLHGGGRWHIDAGPHIPRLPGTAWPEDIPYPIFAVASHVLLQDCPIECGPTGVIPFSHTSGQPPSSSRGDDPELTYNGVGPVVLAAEAGDVQLFVSDVWHRRMPTGPGDAGRFFLQVHYGRRDLAQRLRPTSDSNQLSPAAIERARSDRDRTLIGLHPPLFYDG